MAALGGYLHKLGLKFGIYESPSAQTCAQRAGSYPGATGSAGRETVDAETFASWRVDYLKYDWCAPDSDHARQVRAFTAMRDALHATGRRIVYSINPYSGADGRPPGVRHDWAGIAHVQRIGVDVKPAWHGGTPTLIRNGRPVRLRYLGIGDTIDSATRLDTAGRPGSWHDPDMLVVGVDGRAPSISPQLWSVVPGLTAAEQRTQFGMWAMMSAPMMAGNDLAAMPAAVRDILTNRAVLAIDQDRAAHPGAPVSRSRDDVWTKRLADGSLAVALYNKDSTGRHIRTTRDELRLPAGDYDVADAWTGRRWTTTDSVDLAVEAHDTAVLRLTARSAN